MKLSFKITVAAIATALSIALTAPLSQANGSTDAIYNYYTDAEYSGTQAVASSGLARSVYFTALGKDGVTYSTDIPTENFRQMRSLVDIDQTQQLSLVMTLTNTTAAPLAINNTYSTPKQNYDTLNNKDNAPIVVATSAPTASATPGTFTVESGVRVVESGVGANTFADYPARAQNVNNITQIAFIGTLAPGQSVTVTLPLELTNLADLDLVQGRYAFVRETMRIGRTRASAEEINTSIRFAHRMTYDTSTGVADTLTSTGQYIGAVLEDRSGTRVYSAVPTDIQNLMPNMTASDITIRNFQCDTVNPCDVRSATDEPVLYTGGLYYIDLARIKTALAGTGWSVNNLTADELADFYSYYTGGAATVTDYTTGEVINNGSTDKYGTVHTELFQYIEAHDLTIYVGDPYQPNDTLDWIRDYQKVVLATAQDDLSTIPNISVVNTVDNTTVGVYPVTYKLHFSDGEVVYKTINVTVLDRPTTPVDPTTPPVDPTTPPVDPTNPPVDPTNPPVDPTTPPVDPTTPPVDPTNPPVEPANPPVEPANPPLNIPDENTEAVAPTPEENLAHTGSESANLAYLAGTALALGLILNRRRVKNLD